MDFLCFWIVKWYLFYRYFEKIFWVSSKHDLKFSCRTAFFLTLVFCVGRFNWGASLLASLLVFIVGSIQKIHFLCFWSNKILVSIIKRWSKNFIKVTLIFCLLRCLGRVCFEKIPVSIKQEWSKKFIKNGILSHSGFLCTSKPKISDWTWHLNWLFALDPMYENCILIRIFDSDNGE